VAVSAALRRARTPEQKRAMLDRVFNAWLARPEERLLQLLLNAVSLHSICPPFYAEDAELLEALADRAGKAGAL
jgi:hypothetical protein